MQKLIVHFENGCAVKVDGLPEGTSFSEVNLGVLDEGMDDTLWRLLYEKEPLTDQAPLVLLTNRASVLGHRTILADVEIEICEQSKE